jgi:hypothetical protein
MIQREQEENKQQLENKRRGAVEAVWDLSYDEHANKEQMQTKRTSKTEWSSPSVGAIILRTTKPVLPFVSR